jgi:hypothetical protein
MRMAAELLDGGGDVSAANSSALSCVLARRRRRITSVQHGLNRCQKIIIPFNYIDCLYICCVVAWGKVDSVFTLYRAKTTKISEGSSSEQIKIWSASTEQVEMAACSMFEPKLKYVGLGRLITTNRIRSSARRI